MLKGGNTRLDLLKVVRLAHALGRDGFAVLSADGGPPTFKLDKIAPLNGFEEDGAHSAAVDARALRCLARALAARAPEIWDRALRVWSRKNAVRDLLAGGETVIQFDWDWRKGKPVFKTLLPVAAGRGYGGDFVCLDLGLDPDVYLSLGPEELIEQITVGTKPRPICTVRLNAVPIVLTMDDPLVCDRLPLELRVVAERVRRIRSNPGVRDRVLDAVDMRRTRFKDSEHIEQQLYSGGFFSDHDIDALERFHKVTPEAKLQVMGALRDPRLRYLGRRVMYEEWPQHLPFDAHDEVEVEMCTRHLATGEVPWTTIAGALEDIEALLTDATEQARKILLEYREHLAQLRHRIADCAVPEHASKGREVMEAL